MHTGERIEWGWEAQLRHTETLLARMRDYRKQQAAMPAARAPRCAC